MAQISIYQYALLSQDVYYPPAIKLIPQLETKYGWKRYPDKIFKTYYVNRFYARFYSNKIFVKDHVIAYRGTVTRYSEYGWQAVNGSLVADVALFFHLNPGIADIGYLFYLKAIKFLQQNGKPIHPQQIKLTGHSLGGALAQLVAARTGATAVVFNSPGIGELQGVDPHKKYPNIHNINAQDGVINRYGTVIGDTIRVPVRDGEEDCEQVQENLANSENIAALRHETECLYKQHLIANMITALKHDPKVANLRF